jgi:Phytanoyl-CoA dioxygenase (PhyH)
VGQPGRTRSERRAGAVRIGAGVALECNCPWPGRLGFDPTGVIQSGACYCLDGNWRARALCKTSAAEERPGASPSGVQMDSGSLGGDRRFCGTDYDRSIAGLVAGSLDDLDNLMFAEEKIAELQDKGFCVLKAHFAKSAIEICREGFWPILLDYMDKHQDKPNRGPHRHYLAMPFEPPCFAPEFFFDAGVLAIMRGAMDERVIADQWGCDVPLQGSDHQAIHVDYQRPLFAEAPELMLPPYMLVVNFGLVGISQAHGPIEIAPGTHRMPRREALRSVESAEIEMQSVPLEIGDVLIRHPWALHRGTPNTTGTPRALVTIRYVRRWYADSSRDVNPLPPAVWQSLTEEQQSMLRFPIGPEEKDHNDLVDPTT